MCCILDEFDEDYKVARFREYNTNEDNYHREVMVYSSKTNIWKFIELRQNAEPIQSWHLGTTTALVQNHLLHMIFLEEYGLGANMSRIAQNVNESTYDLWVIKEYGVRESWEILYRQGRSCNLIWYNLGDRQGIDAEFIGLPDASPLSTAYTCRGSLLNFPGGQPIKEILTEDDEEEDEEQYEDEKEDEEDFVDYLYNSI
ncbi:uncharacterized protein LOC141590445 [Silene latifolia]|uniref:uncharacterized protein LOC141590445 n=1 Tax=Silene latifolia TaxID=37657 RepID=UPI003D7727C8